MADTPRQTLQEWFAESNLGSADVAAGIGVHVSTINELLRGRRWPDGTTVRLLHEFTNGVVCVWDAELYVRHRRVPAARSAESGEEGTSSPST
jgi:hypothetical protein